jgi:uncharacterized protein involved in type VI secretion and phage assembly
MIFSRVLNPKLDAVAEIGAIYGVVVGVVTNNKDDANQGRVKLRFPWLSDRDESFFARIAAPLAGKDRGVFFLPEVNDEVLVVFEHGDINRPYVIGSLWSGRDNPPAGNADGANNIKQIKSRSGHTITLNDAEGGETVEIADKTGKNRILFEAAANRVTLESAGDINVTARQGAITLDAREVHIKGSQALKSASGGTLDAESAGAMKLKGATIDLN